MIDYSPSDTKRPRRNPSHRPIIDTEDSDGDNAHPAPLKRARRAQHHQIDGHIRALMDMDIVRSTPSSSSTNANAFVRPSLLKVPLCPSSPTNQVVA